MKSSFKKNIQIGFGLSLLVLIISSAASFISISGLLESAELVRHTNSVIRKLDNIMSTLKDAETGQRGFLLSGDEEFLDRYNGISEAVLGQIEEVRDLVADNPVQSANIQMMRDRVVTRVAYLERLVRLKREGRPIELEYLREGRTAMQELRLIASNMQRHEERLLEQRTENMRRFSSYTPILIIIAAILSVVITIFFYIKVVSDFNDKTRLHQDLEAKDREIRSRIAIIQSVASKISAGDYKIRVNDEDKDDLGSLSWSLNKMAESLETSFSRLQHNEWLQRGIAGLNDAMMGDKKVEELAEEVLGYLADFTKGHVAAFYIPEDQESLTLIASHALNDSKGRRRIGLGDGIVGQCAESGKPIIMNDIADDDVLISFASADIRPRSIAAFPVYHESRLTAVLEIASMNPMDEAVMELFESVVGNIGIALNSAQLRRKQQELLEETQAQAEELQTQHSELENLNTELEAQTQKIQASEEELKVQQEELLQSNQELEERSRLLEEKNQIIVERNLDIQQKAEQLELSTKYKSEFLANMSHELRTPLNSILLLSRLMAESKELATEQVEYAQVIQSAGQGLLSLIDEILDLSKIESGKMDLELKSVPVEEVVSDMKVLFDPIAREKGLSLEFINESSAPEVLVTDKLRLEQILKNLLSNALKFTPRGSVKMIITADSTPGHVRISVKDTGIGIPANKQRQVFEAFQQADGSTRRKFGGTGLGLSISRELARLLGGEITLISKENQGSEFILTVPISVSAAKPPSENRTTNLESALEEHTEPVARPALPERYTTDVIPNEIDDDRGIITENDRVILIVEDDTGFAKALLDYTRQQNYKGIVAVRGDQGIELANLYHPLAILLDIQLPVMDGWEVMEALKSNPATRHIPVHIMSSMHVKKESLMKGAVDFINKPIALDSMQQIFEKLEDALSRHPKKVMIIEENPKHAKALGYFLSNFNINSEISGTIDDGITSLHKKEVDCVILDMGIPDQNAYETLEKVKETEGLENLPIIIFTGKNLSKGEENKIRKYADSIVVKTAHSYQRILDEVGLFLHLVEDNRKPEAATRKKQLGGMHEVLDGKTVLIADDDVRNIFSLTKALEKHNMSVLSAVDGKEALKVLEQNPTVDIVLMDMMMPEMDGYESTSRIRKNPKYRNLPILAVTAKAMMGDREKCIQAGASDYISKPVDVDQLISLLRVWLYDK